MKKNHAAVALMTAVLGALAALGTSGCGPATVRPAAFPDPEVPCPAGLVSWKLEVLDQRAEREASEKMIGSIRSGIQKSFPGCKWDPASSEGLPTISIAVHRFAAVFNDRYYDAAADWTVTASEGGGRTLAEFDANEEESRPAYSGADVESMNEAFRKALQRTVKGLAAMPRIGSLRPPAGTPASAAFAALDASASR